jgi:type II secretory pathway pseudopilin PulG
MAEAMRTSSHRDRDSRSGFTMIELLVLVVIFGLVIVRASEVFSRSSTAQGSVTLREVMEERVRSATEKIANRLREAGGETVEDVPLFPSTSNSIRFRRLEIYDPLLGPDWGDEETISLVQPQGGEGMLVWNDGTRPFVWCTGISSLRFSRDGRRIAFELEADATSPDGDRIQVRRRCNVATQN